MDYIFIKNVDGTQERMEYIAEVKIDRNDYTYLVYKEPNTENYYVAKYKGSYTVNLDTNLTNEEIKMVEKVLNRMLKGKKNETTN